MIISMSIKNGTSVDRSLCTSTYRDYGKTPCLLHLPSIGETIALNITPLFIGVGYFIGETI